MSEQLHILDKLDRIAEIKEQIRLAINAKKVEVLEDVPLSEYPDKILQIGEPRVIPESEYLTFTAKKDNSKIQLINNGNNNPIIYYKLNDAEEYVLWDHINNSIDLNNGDIVKMYGENDFQFSKSEQQYSNFNLIGLFEVSGNCNSLASSIDINIALPYCFINLFQNNYTSLSSSPELPSEIVLSYSYKGMFSECRGLRVAPELPASFVGIYGYSHMFDHSGIVSCPNLPATVLSQYSYSYMFSYTSITEMPELIATSIDQFCYSYMFSNCPNLSKGNLIHSNFMKQSCCEHMFKNCTSLVEPPRLTSTNLAYCCYNFMFEGCTALEYTPELPAMQLENNCYQYMFSGCTSLLSITSLPAINLANACYYGMFENSESLINTVDLPAKSLPILIDTFGLPAYLNEGFLTTLPLRPHNAILNLVFFLDFLTLTFLVA